MIRGDQVENKPLIYIVGGSVRNRADEKIIVENVKRIKGEPFLYEYIERLGREKKMSNSEGCSIAASYGLLKQNVKVRYLRLNEYYLRNGKKRNIEELLELLKEADGMIFALPVYFGDRPSLFNELIEDWKAQKTDFSGMIFGFISVGAKRNGGQETTNVFGMHTIIEMGGMVVGNGPPTSQFGGTTVGGNIGTMENDYFGIMTSEGTGTKVGEVANILAIGRSKEKDKKIRISFLVLQEKDDILQSHIRNIIEPHGNENVEFNIIDITKYNFNRCFACNVCPNGPEDKDYKCINLKDDMVKLHGDIINNDGIILASLCPDDTSELVSAYQIFIERTRYIRRDDFRLTNILTTALSLNELNTHNLFNFRVLTSFVRHNTVIHKGLHNYYYRGEIIDCGSKDILSNFIEYCRILSIGRENYDVGPTRYDAVGY